MRTIFRKLLRTMAHYDPTYYDMYEDANETLFAQLYVQRILRHAAAAGIHPPARLLEAGCQAGRLVVSFATRGFQVTGVDTSGFALHRARRHAHVSGVDATFVRGDLARVVRHRPGPYDVVVCAEVVYLSPHYRTLLQALRRVVRPGGLLCVSHRTQFYYLIEALRQYDVEAATYVLRHGEGPFGESTYFNWQTAEELRALYRGIGLTDMVIEPIDRIAWLSGMSPSRLDEEGQRRWLAAELEGSDGPADRSRYALVIARC